MTGDQPPPGTGAGGDAGKRADPIEAVTAMFADAGERIVEYADVWRSAITRNAGESYAADDFLVDLQTLWGMGVRDVTRVGVAFVDVIAPLVGDEVFGFRTSNDSGTSPGPGPGNNGGTTGESGGSASSG